MIERDSSIDQSAQGHVAADPAKTIKISEFHEILPMNGYYRRTRRVSNRSGSDWRHRKLVVGEGAAPSRHADLAFTGVYKTPLHGWCYPPFCRVVLWARIPLEIRCYRRNASVSTSGHDGHWVHVRRDLARIPRSGSE